MKPVKASATQISEITALINSLRETLSANDPAAPTTRGHLKETAEKLSLALETPGETVQRVAYYVSSSSNPALRELPHNHLQSERSFRPSCWQRYLMETAYANNYRSDRQQTTTLPYLGGKRCTCHWQRASAKYWCRSRIAPPPPSVPCRYARHRWSRRR